MLADCPSSQAKTWHLPLHTDQLQVSAKVPGVQPGNGQSITKACHWSLEVAFVEVWVELRRLIDSRIHVSPYKGNGASRNTATLVRDLDGDVFLSFGHNDLCDGKLFLVLSMCFDDSTKGVLERLKEHMRQMTRNVHEVEVGVADELNFGSIEEAVVILADEASVLDGFLGQIAHVCLCTDDADIGRIRMSSLIGQSNVLAYKHANTDTRHVEAVEESLDVVVYLHSLTLALVFEDALGNGGHDAIVTALDLLESL